ncbi:hypothetical protein D6C78_10647 [Aureobasidium pullulans]|uniref:ABC transporter domain-containing protein n=1 Tax=Aureobasidium pullulans TaxID=5580 RepID=A0A4T0B4D3_AURPU|nr:hypothetical protein D6C78_10647 [Aureobasidium pullulans]
MVEDRSTKRPNDLVADVSGCIEAGEVLALMGPSGSGKMTLPDVFAGRASAIKGSMLIDGTRGSASDFKKLTSFVKQEDILVGSLIVRESLDFAARLSLPRYILKNEEGSRVQTLIDSSGLKKQADTPIGTSICEEIPGGQKRRVSVARDIWDLSQDSKTWKTYHPLEMMDLLATEDFSILQTDPQGRISTLEAARNGFPGKSNASCCEIEGLPELVAGFRIEECAVCSLREIHAGKVPRSKQNLAKSMDRFSSFENSGLIRQSNGSITRSTTLASFSIDILTTI